MREQKIIYFYAPWFNPLASHGHVPPYFELSHTFSPYKYFTSILQNAPFDQPQVYNKNPKARVRMASYQCK